MSAHRLAELFDEPIAAPASWATPGVLHAAAVCRHQLGGLCVLRTEVQSAPRSDDDRLVLGAARARATVILTTAANLRAEPRLSHRLHGSEEQARELRQLYPGKPAQPVILTASGAIPDEHRVLSERPAPIFFTGPDGAKCLLRDGIKAARIHVDANPSVRGALTYAAHLAGTGTVLVEAGPTCARQLYEAPLAVDELMLSLCRATVPRQALGAELFDASTANKLFPSREEASTAWRFRRMYPRTPPSPFVP